MLHSEQELLKPKTVSGFGKKASCVLVTPVLTPFFGNF
jgi:hypothetical protein